MVSKLTNSNECNHLTCHVGEDSCYANVYSLPEESWRTELDKLQPENSGKVSW